MINTKTLTCSHCGGARFTRLAHNDYRCEHCEAVTLVEDDVAQRLEQLLRQLQAPRTPPRPSLLARGSIAAWVVFSVVVVGVFLWRGVLSRVGEPGAWATAVPGLASLDLQEVQVEELREVTKEGETGRYLVTTLHNGSQGILERSRLSLVFFNGDLKQDTQTAWLEADRLLPGESAPVLWKVPEGRPFTRFEVQKDGLSAARTFPGRATVSLEKSRLVRQGRQLTFVGTLTNADSVDAGGLDVRITLHDADRRMVGFGRATPRASVLKPGEKTVFSVDCTRIGAGEIASYDFLVDSERLGLAGTGTPAPLTTVSAPRIEAFDEDLDLTPEELLDEGFALFDTSRLKLTRPRPALDPARRRIFLAELVNESPELIVLKPHFTVTFFDGHREAARVEQRPVAWLAPGERAPVLFTPSGLDRYTDLRVEWGAARRAVPPGPGRALTAEVQDQEARHGSVLVNFSSRYAYKYVRFRGQVKNTGTATLKSPELTISLLDGTGQLTGFATKRLNLTLAPGEQAPFQLDVNQGAADFVRHTVLVR